MHFSYMCIIGAKKKKIGDDQSRRGYKFIWNDPSVALGKGAHQIEVYAVEAACWRGELAWQWSQLPWGLDQMALMAVVHNILDGLHNPPPDKVCGNKLTHRPDARVVDVMKAFDDLLAEGDGDDDPGFIS